MSAERIDKTERLLNLTLALLATKRPMTKAEIFEQIPGYSGSPESMERMFERDKDELRDLGVTVEVLPTDAYFNDEQGYQIIPRDFFLEDISFTYEESLWLAIATNLLHEASPKAGARQGLQKLITVGQVGEKNSSRWALTQSSHFRLVNRFKKFGGASESGRCSRSLIPRRMEPSAVKQVRSCSPHDSVTGI